MHRFCFVWLLTILACVTPAGAATGGLDYPATPVQPVEDSVGGQTLRDPYRWLEQDPRQSAEVAAWVAAQNATSRRFLDGIAARAAIVTRLQALAKVESRSLPRRVGNRTFYSGRAAGDEQVSLWLAVDGQPARRLLDPLRWDAKGRVALSGWTISPDGRYLAYGTRVSGSDWRSWQVLDIASGTLMPDQLRWNKFGDAFWSADSRSLYYTRFPEPAIGSEFTAGNRNQYLARHVLGTPAAQDSVVYAQPETPDHLFQAGLSGNGRWLVINSGYTGGGAFVGIRALPGGPLWRPFQRSERVGVSYRYAGARDDRLYFQTNEGGRGDRVVMVRADQPEAAPQEIFASDGGVIKQAFVSDGLLVVTLLQDAADHVLLVDADTGKREEVRLPDKGSVHAITVADDRASVDFQFTSFARPTAQWRYTRATQALLPTWQPAVPVTPQDYVTEQLRFRARDGKLLSMFVVRRRDLQPSSRTPVLLRGYGGFGLSSTPSFSAEDVVWMDMGGLYAYVTLPGGGEYGEAWHRAGMRERKQAVFDAYFDAADQLIARGWTAPGRVVASGASNGGLLVGAAITQRPGLLGAALPDVAVLDMLRYPHFSNGALWSEEYGSPDDPKMLPVLLAYSPYHNLHAGQAYPPTLITTADTDDRVAPAHSFKFAARLQSVAAADVPVLLSVVEGAGHGGGGGVSQAVQAGADRLAFAAQALDMPAPPITK